MAINQILPFGTVPGANVLTPADYQALAARLGGFTAGTAKSKELNTVWRQASFVTAMIAQYIADKAGQDVLDNGDLAALQAKFVAALAASPAFTGVPTAPTPDVGASSSQIATTAFVHSAMRSRERPGMVAFFAHAAIPEGFLKANGAAVPVVDFPELNTAIYCGDPNNATAPMGYRCNDALNPSSSRSATGKYVVLPDLRGMFVRGWDDGRGVDADRPLGSDQAATAVRVLVDNFIDYQVGTFAIGARNIDGIMKGAGSATSTIGSDINFYSTTAVTSTGAGDNNSFLVRPRNVALHACIKY